MMLENGISQVFVSTDRQFAALVLDDEETIIVVHIDNEAHGDQVEVLDAGWDLLATFDDFGGETAYWKSEL